ncbi:MAG: hypothetical protein GX921_08655 [Bacteroidales bacterium]|nr:hypothetical protein [Bacteroidales bacterium]
MNSDKFLDYFKRIETFLNLTQRHDDSFVHKINSSNNKAVRFFAEELKFYARLRNAIVHNPKENNKAIAEPHSSTVQRLIEIHDKITKPKRLIPIFQVPVFGAHEEDYINDILVQMKKYSFSQFPLFDNKERVVELISTNTIARWISTQLEDSGTIMIEKVKVKDFIKEIEYPHNYRFIDRDASIYDAHDCFMDEINENKKNLDVLFITETGKPSEAILGLVTIEDIVLQMEV